MKHEVLKLRKSFLEGIVTWGEGGRGTGFINEGLGLGKVYKEILRST